MSADSHGRILVVDDHVEMAELLRDQLGDAGFDVDVAQSGSEALRLVQGRMPDVVIADLRMAGMDGLDLLTAVRQIDPELPVLIMTAFADVDTAVDAIKRGAFHYFRKPFQLGEILVYVQRALAERRLRDENRALLRLAADRGKLTSIRGHSAAIEALLAALQRVAQTSATVLVRGESGTGKELVARALHALGPRRDRAFVAVNCTALPATLLESELFGHVRGSFTGASTARRGLFVEADGGTLLFDEIGDMPAELQAKLLRVIEDGSIRPIGSDAPRTVDVRIIAATNQPLEELVANGRFRADLLFRLNVVPVTVPPLRDRPDDIPVLVDHFIAQARATQPQTVLRALAPEALAAMARYRWPGNVRELENTIERLAVMCPREEAQVGDLEAFAPAIVSSGFVTARPEGELVSLREMEDEYIEWVIARCNGNKTRAAEILGIDVSTIHRRDKTRMAR